MSKCHVNLKLYATVSIINEKTDGLNDPPMAWKLKSGRNRIPKAIPLPCCCPRHMPSSQCLVPVFHVLAPQWSSLKCLIHSFNIECSGAACLKSPVLFRSYIPLVRDNLINYYVPYFTPSITQDYPLERKKTWCEEMTLEDKGVSQSLSCHRPLCQFGDAVIPLMYLNTCNCIGFRRKLITLKYRCPNIYKTIFRV